MPGRTPAPNQYPTVLYSDVFRATPAIFEEAVSVYARHTHKDLTDLITCVENAVRGAQEKTREVLSRQIGSIRSLDTERAPEEDKTSLTEEDDPVASELTIPVAVENLKPQTAMKYRFAAVIGSGEDANITIIKTKRRMQKDTETGKGDT